MNHWQQVERCVREIYYDIENERLTTAGQVDDRMLDCARYLVDRQNRIKWMRLPAIRIQPLQERDVQPEPR